MTRTRIVLVGVVGVAAFALLVVVATVFSAWTGWNAVGALGQALGAAATLVTVIFFWRQLVQMRSDSQAEQIRRRNDYERTLTPLVTLSPTGGMQSQGLNRISDVLVSADGSGVVYNLQVSLFVDEANGGQRLEAGPIVVIRHLRAPGSAPFTVPWTVKPRVVESGRLEATFVDLFHRSHTLRHPVRLNPNGLEITGEPQWE